MVSICGTNFWKISVAGSNNLERLSKLEAEPGNLNPETRVTRTVTFVRVHKQHSLPPWVASEERMRGNTELEDLSQRNTGGQDESERQNGPEAVDVVLRGGRLSGGWMLWKRVGFLMLGSVGWICITMVSSTVTMRAPCGVCL